MVVRYINQFAADAANSTGIAHSKLASLLGETYAQESEDIIVTSLLRARLRMQNRSLSSASFVEIGANHPIYTNNTYLLYSKFGARGVLCEADPALIEDLRRARPEDEIVNLAVSDSHERSLVFHVGNATELSSLIKEHVESFGGFNGLGGVTRTLEVKNRHINDFLGALNLARFYFLAIDCEGMDFRLLNAMDFDRFRPYVLQCEPSDHYSPGNGDKIIELMKRRRYRLTAATDVNLIFSDIDV